jgi:nicotinate-nucleotide adenylyltransferase
VSGQTELHAPTRHGSPLAPPIGLLGGTFDPVHFGHLRLAQELCEYLRLAEVRFVPAGVPPHRRRPETPPRHRLEMVRLAVEGNPAFRVDGREVEKEAPSYTVETLRDLRRELGEDQPLCLLLGADAFLGLTTWHEWRALFDLAHLAVAYRPGFPCTSWDDVMPGSLESELARRQVHDPEALRDTPSGKVLVHEITLLDISASGVRGMIGAGRSPRYLVPERVLTYIRQHHLYQAMA